MNLFKAKSKIGIDLGTESIRVVINNKGIVINEPSIIAIEKATGEVVAVGNSAKEMIGKTPDKIEALKPLKESAIADLKATELIFKEIMGRLRKEFNIVKPDVLMNMHVGKTIYSRWTKPTYYISFSSCIRLYITTVTLEQIYIYSFVKRYIQENAYVF